MALTGAVACRLVVAHGSCGACWPCLLVVEAVAVAASASKVLAKSNVAYAADAFVADAAVAD